MPNEATVDLEPDLDPELQPILIAMKLYEDGVYPSSDPIFSAFDSGYLNFNDSVRLNEFLSEDKGYSGYWLQQYIMSHHSRAKKFFNMINPSDADNVLKLIIFTLDHGENPEIHNIDDAISYLGGGCYILAMQLKTFKSTSDTETILPAMLRYIKYLEGMFVNQEGAPVLFATIKKELEEVDSGDYMSALAAMVSINSFLIPNDIRDICDEYLDFSDKKQMMAFFKKAPDFFVNYFSSQAYRVSNFLKLGDSEAIEELLSITISKIKKSRMLYSVDDLELLLEEAILLYQLISSPKCAVVSNVEIEAIIFELIKKYTHHIHCESREEYLQVQYFFIGLENVIKSFVMIRTTANFVDAHKKNILHYVTNINNDSFVEFLLHKLAKLDEEDLSGVSAVMSLLYNDPVNYLQKIKAKIECDSDGWQLILEHALLSSYSNDDHRYAFKLIPLLLRLLSETFRPYENLALKFQDACLWDVSKFEHPNAEFADVTLLSNMLKNLEAPIGQILDAIKISANSATLNKCLLILLQRMRLEHEQRDGADAVYDLGVWQYLAENEDLCTDDLSNYCLANDSIKNGAINYDGFINAVNNIEANPFSKAVESKNVAFLVFATKFFKGTKNLDISNHIKTAAVKIINNYEDVASIAPLQDYLKTLKPPSYFYRSPDFVLNIQHAIRQRITDVRPRSQSSAFCMPMPMSRRRFSATSNAYM